MSERHRVSAGNIYRERITCPATFLRDARCLVIASCIIEPGGRFFPKATPRAVKRGASKLGEKPARNSTKAVFLRGNILSREYLLVPKSTSALSPLRIPERRTAAERKGGEREKRRSPTRLKLDGYGYERKRAFVRKACADLHDIDIGVAERKVRSDW